MLAERIEFRDFDAVRVGNLGRLVASGPWSGGGLGRGNGPAGLIVLRRSGRVVKALRTGRGPIEPGPVAAAASLSEAAGLVGARWAVAVDVEALVAANEAASARLAVGCDLVDLLYEIVRALADQAAAGRLEVWPEIFEGIKVPPRDAIARLFDTALPPHTSALAYVFEGSTLRAELICVRGAREVATLAGHDALRCGPPPGRWREGYGQLLEAARRELAPPSIGVFVELEALRRLMGTTGDGELPRALARRDLIIDPLPPWLAGPLGALAARDAVEAGRRVGERLLRRVGEGMGPRATGLGAAIAGKVADRLRRAAPIERVGETVERLRKSADLTELLGFDPLRLGARLIELCRSDDDPTDRRSPG